MRSWVLWPLMVAFFSLTSVSQDPLPETLRAEASKLFEEQNWKDALQRYEKLLNLKDQQVSDVVVDMERAIECQRRLDLHDNFDATLQLTILNNPQAWQVYERAAQLLDDRQQALQWYFKAMPLVEREPSKLAAAQFYASFADEFLSDAKHGNPGILQKKTDLLGAIDLEPKDPFRHDIYRFAPLDEKGEPILYKTPASFEQANSDGERARWLMRLAMELDEQVGNESLESWAYFMSSQFSVDTLQTSMWFRRTQDSDSSSQESKTSGILEVQNLSDDETIAYIANGIKRFKLPDENNPIRIYRQLANQRDSVAAVRSLEALAAHYTSRRQFDKATDCLREAIERFGENQSIKSQLDNIIAPCARFDPTDSHLAGVPVQLSLVYRNAKHASFTAFRVDVEAIFAEFKNTYSSSNRNAGSESDQNSHPLYSLQRLDELFQDPSYERFATQVAKWDLPLEPRDKHWDRRVLIDTPLQSAGLYLVNCKLEDGSDASRILVWVQDTSIINKPYHDNQQLYYLSDAESGEPLKDIEVEFFGYRHNKKGEIPTYLNSRFSRKTDAKGEVVIPNLDRDYEWTIVARDSNGRFSMLSLDRFYPTYANQEPFEPRTKGFGVTDRPVYRPGDTIRGKIWIGTSTYDPDVAAQLFAKEPITVTVRDPQETEMFEGEFTSDRFGAIEFEVPTKKDASLGVYRVEVNKGDMPCELAFRIEEYRKPEFEVQVVAPSEPVPLGETIRATVRANYYFGSPVTDATAIIRVERSIYSDDFFPSAPYDWCFGRGYGWLASDCAWHPSWHSWRGCNAPRPSWLSLFPMGPPELVLEKEVALDGNGEAKIEIDTAIAKGVQAESDHRYTISVQVRDSSRRTIDARGSVIAARRPFKIYTWLDRGFLRTAEKTTVHFSARTPNGKGVKNSGVVELFQLKFDAKRELKEVLVQTWKVATNEEGHLDHPFQIDRSGQYRIRLRMADAANREVEGGYVFAVHGKNDNPSDYRYNSLELIPDMAHYRPGQKLQLKINSEHPNANVLLFVRPESGNYPKPEHIKLEGRSQIVEIPIEAKDQPNFFVEAVTVFDGEVHTVTREILVPPEQRMLSVETKANRDEYLPGGEAQVDVVVKDVDGRPVEGSTAIAVYDRSIDTFAADVLPQNIREYFWKWRREHFPISTDNLSLETNAIYVRSFSVWSPLGLFGETLASDADLLNGNKPDIALLRLTARRDRKSQANRNMFESIRGMGLGGMGGMGGMGGGGMGGMDERLALAASASQEATLDEQPNFAQTTVRKDFADTAFWAGNVVTDKEGRATVRFKMPESLTSWKIQTWSVGEQLRVGSSSQSVVTRKNLLVRLQAPRFLVERDKVSIASIVNNDLSDAVDVRVRLEIDGETQLRLIDNSKRDQTVHIESHGQARIDWMCEALAEGEVTIRTMAESTIESDAMQIKLPILVHGFMKQDSFAGTVRSNEKVNQVELDIPNKRREQQSELIIRLSPSLAASMIDALPYLADYPHGCTEQTLNRFLPTVVTQRVLKKMEVDLKSLSLRKNNLNAQELGDPNTRKAGWNRFASNPVYDEQLVNEMVESGVKRLAEMQNEDGGWGWFSGEKERSWPHTTAVVVRGLMIARKNNVAIFPDVIERGVAWLEKHQNEQLRRFSLPVGQSGHRGLPNDADALVFSILAENEITNDEMQKILFEKREGLGVYGKTLLALAVSKLNNPSQLTMLRQNIEQFLVEDEENDTAHLRNPSPWWYWHGSEIEANAHYLKLLSKIEPQGMVAPRLVKYLLNNRKNATYWNSTRDTALVVEAFADYLRATEETKEDIDAEVYLDDARLGSVRFTLRNLFEVNNTIAITGKAIPSGKHRLEIRKKGEGNLYWNAYVRNFTLEEEIPASGLEVKVERHYYLLTPTTKNLDVVGDRGQIAEGKRSAFDRKELREGEEIASGAMVEVELLIESKNDYEYVLLEDSKAASLEPIDVTSGYNWDDPRPVYREYRDSKVCFFLRTLPAGKHVLHYRVRSEAPGNFTALPAVGQGMYSPELRGSTADHDLKIIDR